ncbi:molybdopterin molybdochelatase /molybdenum cofactor cytidylyltransferase [Breoghania corrubedonensis]|uniref:Molybdopterin molybdochelatase /molybdenum cofactor cytidylyltransferase n=1 Tax=Breoghania corrubedonensis TaxID=665038 RepID=A0A2T5VGB0_9HYPH|nr:molybdopterin-binding/glycosyltransferase family 2 protein [Breoghania corrubedonensis]PTW62768.1 molybdopterin molybdochelatase /molybdenum cofactor cytidylyltransferase [Breoghania corrubedonensis]
MIFATLPLAECEGATLAHSLKIPGLVLKKGTELTAAHIAALSEAGVGEITVARLAETDVKEDRAAALIAEGVAGPGVTVERAFTGRANIFADAAGVLVVDRAGIDRLNRIDPAITLATLGEYAPVEAGRMVATVKIIPYAVAGDLVATASAHGQEGLLRLAPYRAMKVALISTRLASLKERTIDKTVAVTRERLRPAGAKIIADIRIPHEAGVLAEALRKVRAEGAELVIVFGASANVDLGDVVPRAIEAAGGRVEHFGMPVDPGNLLVMARLGDIPVIGAPGCARSPSENGFDWVLRRTLAGLAVTADDLTGLGVGGLLMEIVSRPQPRRAPQPDISGAAAPRVAILVLAAGRSTRMGGPNKLLATIDGEPLVRIAARHALDADPASVTVVTGHMADKVGAALSGLDVAIVHNQDYAEGLSTSLKAGIAALPGEIDAALVMLADMPQVSPEIITRLIDAYDPPAGALIVVPTVAGKQGNPVLWSKRYFADLMTIQGDVGARHLIGTNAQSVVEVEVGEAARLDLDTPEALADVGGEIVRTLNVPATYVVEDK